MAEEKKQEVVLKILAGIGLAAVLFAAGWAGFRTIKLLPNAMSSASTVLSTFRSTLSPNERIIVSLEPSVVAPGENFSITWEHIGKKKDGFYSLFYQCTDSVYFKTEDEKIVFCNEQFRFVNQDNRLNLTASTEREGLVSVSLAILFTENNSSKINVSGQAVLTVGELTDISLEIEPRQETEIAENSVATQPETVPVETINVPVPQRFSDPAGIPDFAITILDTGIVDKTTGEFTSKSPVDTSDRVAVKFEVRNLGTKETGVWIFKAKLPTPQLYTYTSVRQDSLFPNERIEFILGFDRIAREPRASIVINVDPENLISEVNELNNDAGRELTVNVI